MITALEVTMSTSNLRESLKNQFRGAYGIRAAGEQERDEVAGTQAGQEPANATGTHAAATPASAAIQPIVPGAERMAGTRQEDMATPDKETKKSSGAPGQLPCGITDFLNAAPEEQLCYSLGEQMAAILKYLLQLPKPWVNLTYADIRNDAGEPVPAESRRTMVGILQKKGFIRERRRADIGIYKGITFVLDPELAGTFCRLNGLEPPAWLYDARPNKKPAARSVKKNRGTDRAYDELVAQNEKLRKEIEELKALLVSKTHGQVQE